MNEITNIIKCLTPGLYISKKHKTSIQTVINVLNKTKDKDLISVLTKLNNSNKFTNTLQKQINQIVVHNVETNVEIVKDLIEIIIDDNLEVILDSECERYNKYNECNPAPYISYDKDGKRWIYQGKKNIKKKFLKNLIPVTKEKIGDKNGENFHNIIPEKKIQYKGRKIIIYMIDNRAYFDINHIINLFDAKSKLDKYKEYKSKIVAKDFRDNDYNGFYIKEFIDTETFYNMILHTNSIFSNKFKDDISKILAELTNDGQLMIKDDNVSLVKKVKKSANNFIESYEYTQTFDNMILTDFIKDRIKEMKQINWNKYCSPNIHVMYCFVTTLDDIDNRIICKIGYSADLVSRFKSLQSEYKSKFYLLGLKTVFSQKDEKEFHNLLKIQFPEFVINKKINNHDKDELYVFDVNLYKSFLCYQDKVPFSNNIVELEKDCELMMTEYFKNMEQNFELDLLNKMSICKVSNQHQENIALANYSYLTIKENNRHLECMKDKEIELKHLEIEFARLGL